MSSTAKPITMSAYDPKVGAYLSPDSFLIGPDGDVYLLDKYGYIESRASNRRKYKITLEVNNSGAIWRHVV